MRIVDRKTFLQLPKGTVYSKFNPSIFYELNVKTSNPEDEWGNDWVHIPLIEGFIKGDRNHIDYDYFEFDLDCSVRDGSYEEEQLFAVYDKNDILKLIARLTYSFLESDMY